MECGIIGKLGSLDSYTKLEQYFAVCGMLGLSESEMYDSSPEYVMHRLTGFMDKLRWSEDREWERTRMIAFVTHK